MGKTTNTFKKKREKKCIAGLIKIYSWVSFKKNIIYNKRKQIWSGVTKFKDKISVIDVMFMPTFL